MSRWTICFAPDAENDLGKLDNLIRSRVIEKLEWVQNNFDNITPLPLDNKWRGFYKIRIGDWRVIYKIDWEKYKIIIVAIGHRSKIYTKRKN